MSQSPRPWHSIQAHSGLGWHMRLWDYGAWAEGQRTERGWDGRPTYHTLEYNLPRYQWWNTDGVCMRRSRKLTGTVCQPVRRNTYCMYLTSVFWRANLSAPAPFRASQGPCGHGMAWGTTSTASTGGTASVSCRSTPPHYPNARGVRARFCHDALVIGTMSPINVV